MKYDLNHLTQDNYEVYGPIQDDEALFLYSIVRGKRIKTILEVGGLSGYSATNFIKAMEIFDGKLYTVDINPVPKVSNNHIVITKNANDLKEHDLNYSKIEMLFFDCHDMIQMDLYYRLLKLDIIDDKTIIALHDTNLHYEKYCSWSKFVKKENGYIHQDVERKMVNIFKDLGYDIFCLHTTKEKHDKFFCMRHGITICQKFSKLEE